MKPKFGIVSSFDVLCGNATYSQALLDGLPEHVEPIRVEVPLLLQKCRNIEKEEGILDLVKSCDVVNIQMELGLYGSTPKQAYCFLKKIINNCRGKASLTMHRVEESPVGLLRSLYLFYKTKSIASLVKRSLDRHLYRVHTKLIQYAVRRGATFIVHTVREKKRILSISPAASVYVHPIVWPDAAVCNESESDIVDLTTCFSNSERPTVGLFGFVSDYKNFYQVIRASTEGLFNVLLAGSTHPMSDYYGKSVINQYHPSAYKRIDDLVMNRKAVDARHKKKISLQYGPEDKGGNLSGQFFSYTSPDDAALIRLMQLVDVVVIPYLEVGQSGSGIASMAIQYGKKVVFSDTKCVTELIPFLSKRPVLFDTQSDSSLISALKQVFTTEAGLVRFNGYDFKTNIAAYMQSVGLN